MHEDLLSPEEGWRPTNHPAIREVVSPVRTTADDLEWTVERLAGLCTGERTDELVRVLKRSVTPGTQPSTEEQHKNLRPASPEFEQVRPEPEDR